MSNLHETPALRSLKVGDPVEDLSPSPALPRADLRGQAIKLSPLDARRDAAALYAISHGDAEKESVWTYMSYGPFENAEAMQTFLEQQERSEDPLFFTVIEASTGPVGMVSFLAIDGAARRLELGHIWYGMAYQRGRTNTETIYLMLCEAFDHLRCRRVEWKCDALNQASRNAAMRLGFQYEGVFRQHLLVKGRNRDTAWFSIVDGEWATVRAALERWLDWSDGRPPGLASLRERELNHAP